MRQEILLNAFIKATEDMDINPLELDRFMHNELYQPMANIDTNLENLQTFINRNYE